MAGVVIIIYGVFLEELQQKKKNMLERCISEK